MTTETASPVEGMSSVDLPADAPESFSSVNEAAAYFSELQEKRKQSPAESADTATAEPELAEKANADPETAPSEEPEADEPAEVPPIDPPRSWTQAEKERFQSLPRETQEYLSHREQERETALRRSQNEIAEQRKAAQAEREAAEKVRQQYEANLPALMQELENVHNNQFPDIKSMDDVVRLSNEASRVANEDPFRALQIQTYLNSWQVHQQKMATVKVQLDKAEGEKSQKQQSEWMQHVHDENSKAAEFIPELADKAKGEALTKRVASELLPELGFKDSELADLANGKAKLSIYDHRVQRLLADALKLRDIQSAPRAVAAKPLPPVQKPGTARSSGNALNEQIQALSKELDRTGDLKTAQKLYALQSRRAS